MTTREFHLGDVLTITTGILVTPRHIEGVYDILNYMTGDNLYTHQLPRATKQCAPALLAQHPQLAEIAVSRMGPDEVAPWLSKQCAIYGETLPVSPLPLAERDIRDPLSELMEMRPDKPIIVVTPEEREMTDGRAP